MNKNDFKIYARDYGISSMNLHYHNQKIENSLTPYVIEERQMNMTQIDIFSMLMKERIIWLGGEVNDNMCVVTQAQLQYLDSVDNNDITFQINSPGGSVSSGLGIIDVMEYISSDIRTVNMSLCASMGALLLGAGTKGKRTSLKYARTMIHQSSGGFRGEWASAKIDFEEWTKTNDLLFNLLGNYCGKSSEQVKMDATRDLWLSSDECLSYGLIDEIITKKVVKKKK
jgi:ATP-dependent Clp protease protease subunit